jgi:hypothetical protein
VVAQLILMVNPLYRIMSVAMLNYDWCLALRPVPSTSWVWPKKAKIINQVASLPTNPVLDLAAASQHVGLIERNIHFLKEKTRLICHSLPFERIPALMLVCMVLHSVQFMNSFP